MDEARDPREEDHSRVDRWGIGLDEDAILDAIRAHPAEAADALAAIQLGGDEKPLTADSIGASARIKDVDKAELWLEHLVSAGLVLAFVSALWARGVAFDDEALADPDGAIPIEALSPFLPGRRPSAADPQERPGRRQRRARRTEPRPHRVARDRRQGPGQAQVPAPNLSVLLADDSKQRAEGAGRVPVRVRRRRVRPHPAQAGRRCRRSQRRGAARHGAAGAAHLGYVPLAAPAPPRPKSAGAHPLPGGQDRGIDFGFTRKIRNVTARWRHDVTDEGRLVRRRLLQRGPQVHRRPPGRVRQRGALRAAGPLRRRHPRACEEGRRTDDALVARRNGPREPSSSAGTCSSRRSRRAGEAGSRVRGVRIKRKAIELRSVPASRSATTSSSSSSPAGARTTASCA